MIDRRDRFPDTLACSTALDCLAAGIRAARPDRLVPEAVTVEGDTLTITNADYDLAAYDEVVVLGGGNAASQVAYELESLLGDRIDGGVVVTDDPVDGDRVRVLPGDHPIPSERGVESTRELLAAARDAGRAAAGGERVLVLGVITGGGSALMAAPAEGLSLADLRSTTDALLASGASIEEVNAVRKHCSAVKGGLLAAATAPATVACLVVSDVIGNDLGAIASGPFVPDGTTYADAREVIQRYEVTVPDAVRDRLDRGAAGDLPETPKAGEPAFDGVATHVIGDGTTAMTAAADAAADAGFEPLLLSSRIRGEAREAAKSAVAIAEEVVATGNPVPAPAVLISGGETTVTIRGDGTGGPNQEFALAAAVELDPGAGNHERVAVGAVDTDGIDGPTDAAGGLVQAETIPIADGRRALADNDAYPVLDAAGALVRTGPTGTNVNDLRVVVVTDAE